MVKLKAPKGCGGASHKGQWYAADRKGIVEVPDDARDVLCNPHHGFAPLDSADDRVGSRED